MDEHQDQSPENVEVTLKVFMAETELYRKSLCGKIDDLKVAFANYVIEMRDINKTLTALPCKERKAWYDGMGKQVGFMWGVLVLFLLVCITAVVTSRIASHQVTALASEVEQIKKVSYGYQDYVEFLKTRQKQ